MKKLFFRFILLMILAIGMSWGIYALTSPENELLIDKQENVKHYITYQLPLGLPRLQLWLYW